MDYNVLLKEAEVLLEDQPNQIALLSNASAFIFQTIDDLNWSGFYLYDGKSLKVGPFQGKVACNTIPIGKGVCGEAARDLTTKIVDDVLAYENHIACDGASRSEVVFPIVLNGQLFGVLDIDSPIHARFDEALVQFLESFVQILAKFIDNSLKLR